jgi:uncharacterized membrane protein
MFTRETIDRHRGSLFIGAILVASSAGALAMLAARMFYSGTVAYFFLVWNLFLAWVPLGLALCVHFLAARSAHHVPLLALGFLWLLFFPNAPYLLTDIIHLHPHFGVYDRPLRTLAGVSPLRDVPLWYDAALILAFASSGLMVAFASLHLVQRAVADRLGSRWGWTTVVAVLGLTGFGVSLGRFQRWNSWDLFTRPAALLADVSSRLLNPLAHPRTTAATVLMASFLLLTYLALGAFAGVREESRAPERP